MAIAILAGVIFNYEAVLALSAAGFLALSVMFMYNLMLPAYWLVLILMILLLLGYFPDWYQEWQRGNLKIRWPSLPQPSSVQPGSPSSYQAPSTRLAEFILPPRPVGPQPRSVNGWVVTGLGILFLLVFFLANLLLVDVYIRTPYIVIVYVVATDYVASRMRRRK